MKIVFAGPSLPRATPLPSAGWQLRPPAAMGDVLAAVLEGAAVIGLIDGTFEAHAAVWHKEILFALAEGVQVYGAASMGALRAAECAAFGMVGVGRVFEAYQSGDLVDDAAVAVLHAPADLGSLPLTEPLVTVTATADALLAAALITPDEQATVVAAAQRLFFKDRTLRAVIAACQTIAPDRRVALAELFRRYRRDIKAEDAMALLAVVAATDDARRPPPAWSFVATQAWTELFSRVEARLAPGGRSA